MIENIVLIIGTLFTGLIAGVFYSFMVAIVPAFHLLRGKEHIKAMQHINTKIETPLFFLSFFGPIILLPLATFQHWGTTGCILLIIASILYILGAIGVTIFGNVPLNDELAKVDIIQISEEEAEKIREGFQGSGRAWMRFHVIRTLATIAAMVLLLLVWVWK